MAILDILTLVLLFLFILGSILGFGWAAKKLGFWEEEDKTQPVVAPPMIDPSAYVNVAIILMDALNRMRASGIPTVTDHTQIIDPRCTACHLNNGAVAAVFRLPCDTEKLPRSTVFQCRLQEEVDGITVWNGLPPLVVYVTYEPHKGGVILQVGAKADLCNEIQI